MKTLFIRILLVTLFFSGFGALPGNHLTIVYTSPLPGSQYLPSGTTITIRLANPPSAVEFSQLRFEVNGSLSGKHPGKINLANDHRTVIFTPDTAFHPGENVHVQISSQVPGLLNSASMLKDFQFVVSSEQLSDQQRMKILESVDDMPAAGPVPASQFSPQPPARSLVTVSEDIPAVTITTPADQTADGYLFLADIAIVAGTSPRNFNLILDNSGDLVYYQKLARSLDFKVLPNGTLSYFDPTYNNFAILDNTYRLIDVVKPGNGYPNADVHDLQLTPEGDYIFLIYDPQVVDMSAYGGNPQASVIGLVIQEVDANKNVVFQWRSWDHVQIPDTYSILTNDTVDYVHGNAVEIDNSGNLMVSARNLAEVAKINRITGDYIWRLGGKNNEFTFINDPREFYLQHDIRQLADGNITLFDNHNGGVPSYSRGVEYELDENAKTVTQVWEFRNTPDSYSIAMGNTQRLPNGNTLIGWGYSTDQVMTEVKPDGTKAFEMVLEAGYGSYRSYRLTWHGYPTWLPALVVQNQNSDVILSTSWNGATEIASYRVYGGKTTLPATLLTEQAKAGFETTITLEGVGNSLCYFRVMPVDNLGRTTQYSDVVFNPACVPTQYYLPMIANLNPN